MYRAGLSLLTALVVASAVPAGSVAQPRDIGGVGLTVFEDRNYRGGNAKFWRYCSPSPAAPPSRTSANG